MLRRINLVASSICLQSAGRSVIARSAVFTTPLPKRKGVLGLTRGMAKEVAPFGITVNANLPRINRHRDGTEILYPAEQLRAYEDSFPISFRLGTPDEVAQLIVFLATDAAYITGASIDINLQAVI